MINKDELLRKISQNVMFAEMASRTDVVENDPTQRDRLLTYVDEGRTTYRFLSKLFDEDKTLDV